MAATRWSIATLTFRPDFTQSELDRVPDFITKIAPQIGSKNAELTPVDPGGNVAA